MIVDTMLYEMLFVFQGIFVIVSLSVCCKHGYVQCPERDFMLHVQRRDNLPMEERNRRGERSNTRGKGEANTFSTPIRRGQCGDSIRLDSMMSTPSATPYGTYTHIHINHVSHETRLLFTRIIDTYI